MINNKLDYDLGQWKNLTDEERINIINQYWDAYNPSVGLKTKTEIIDDFIKTSKLTARQFGIKCFGWTVYMIYVVVDNSQQRVPSNFLGLQVNKGIVVDKGADNETIVAFKYGGTVKMNLTDKIVIR